MTIQDNGNEDVESIHVLDLPQLYTRPSFKALLDALALVATTPASWEKNEFAHPEPGRHVNEAGVTSYLTTIVSSTLWWLDDDSMRERVWELASVRLSERAGRTATPAMTRIFTIPTMTSSVDIKIHEPSLTADNLGLKTWGSSYLLAKRLHLVPVSLLAQRSRVLELGSGTGLVGIAAASIWGSSVHLTDLPDIVPNLTRNVQENTRLITRNGGYATTAVLDWSDFGDRGVPNDSPEGSLNRTERFGIILAADPLYSPEHPQLLVHTIRRWLSKSQDAQVLIELPLRDGYAPEIDDFRAKMQGAGLKIIDDGEETGYDDWGSAIEGGSRPVRCWWGSWTWDNHHDLEA